MAEVNTGDSGGRHGGGKAKPKKMSTKIDMTPMVDLAFLLLTFFMLTTTFSKPKIMEITLPEDKARPEEQTKMYEGDVLNIMLLPDNRVLWYIGLGTDAEPEETNYSKNGVRKVIFQKKREIPEDKFMVLIKPHPKSKYKNLVDIYDEMNITRVSRYAQVDMTADEIKMAEEALASVK